MDLLVLAWLPNQTQWCNAAINRQMMQCNNCPLNDALQQLAGNGAMQQLMPNVAMQQFDFTAKKASTEHISGRAKNLGVVPQACRPGTVTKGTVLLLTPNNKNEEDT